MNYVRTSVYIHYTAHKVSFSKLYQMFMTTTYAIIWWHDRFNIMFKCDSSQIYGYQNKSSIYLGIHLDLAVSCKYTNFEGVDEWVQYNILPYEEVKLSFKVEKVNSHK